MTVRQFFCLTGGTSSTTVERVSVTTSSSMPSIHYSREQSDANNVWIFASHGPRQISQDKFLPIDAASPDTRPTNLPLGYTIFQNACAEFYWACQRKILNKRAASRFTMKPSEESAQLCKLCDPSSCAGKQWRTDSTAVSMRQRLTRINDESLRHLRRPTSRNSIKISAPLDYRRSNRRRQQLLLPIKRRQAY